MQKLEELKRDLLVTPDGKPFTLQKGDVIRFIVHEFPRVNRKDLGIQIIAGSHRQLPTGNRVYWSRNGSAYDDKQFFLPFDEKTVAVLAGLMAAAVGCRAELSRSNEYNMPGETERDYIFELM